MNPELKKYIDDARSLGRSDAQIAQDLKSGGWNNNDISSALGVTGADAVKNLPEKSGGSFSLWWVLLGVLFLPFIFNMIFYAVRMGGNRSGETIALPPLNP